MLASCRDFCLRWMWSLTAITTPSIWKTESGSYHQLEASDCWCQPEPQKNSKALSQAEGKIKFCLPPNDLHPKPGTVAQAWEVAHWVTESVLMAFHQVVFKHIHQYFIPIPRGVSRGPEERFLSLIKTNGSSLTLRTTALSWKGPGDKLNFASKTPLHSHIFNVFTYYTMCMNVLPACMYVHHMDARCPWKSEEGIGSPGTGVTGSELHVHAGNPIQVLGRATYVLNCWTNSLAPASPSRLRQLGVIFRPSI